MFTGIIQHRGIVRAVAPSDAGARLSIDAHGWQHTPSRGDSIAVDGCCLTVAEPPSGPGFLQFDVIPQTLRLTTLGRRGNGDLVNLEPAVTASSLMDGHIVQGHVDGLGVVRAAEPAADEVRVRIEPPGHLKQFIIEQGSVAVNGVSLTVAALTDQWFEVALIPTTLELTNLGSLQPEDAVNIEADYIARTVVRWMERFHGLRSETTSGSR